MTDAETIEQIQKVNRDLRSLDILFKQLTRMAKHQRKQKLVAARELLRTH